jgi:hypothetical protein
MHLLSILAEQGSIALAEAALSARQQGTNRRRSKVQQYGDLFVTESAHSQGE